ncbi:restriction endonuclease subunit S [Streptomyces sp. 900105755]
MTSPWMMLPLWSVATVGREVVEPTDLGEEVVHYSIPSVDATGTGQVEKSESIKSAKLRLSGGEVLISKLNPRKSRVLSVAASPLPIVSSTEFVGLRAGSALDSRYLAYLLQSEFIRQELDARVQSVTRSHQRVAPEDITHLNVAVAPLPEQRRIADFLDAETARIDQLALKRRQMRSLLTLKRERVIESTLGLERAQMTDGLVPLKYLVADVTVGIVITPAKWYVEAGGTPALRGLNVKPGFISTGDLVQISADGHAENRKSRLNTGDVVVVRTGQAGAAAVVPAELDGANCIDLIVVRPGKKLSPRYLQYVLNSDYASARVTEHSVGSIQAHFNVGAMKQIPIPSIPRTEQDEIVRLLDIRIGALDLLHRKLDYQEQLLTERRQALIAAAVTGQFDVTTASGRNVMDGVTT